jgi:hypothetical protein
VSDELNNYDYDDDGLEERYSFVGKFFLLRERYWTEQGMWPEGYAGVVKAPVGSDHHLIQACKAGFKQQIVATEFFVESRALIFDTFDELKEAKERIYPRRITT